MEGAIVLSVFLVVLFSMLDLAFLVLHQNTLAEAARRLSREVMVHGEQAAPERPVWGPDTVSGTAADSNEYAGSLRPELVTFNHADVRYTVEWIDASNSPDDRIRVTVTYNYDPLVPFVLGNGSIPLQAISTMRIAH